MSGDTLGNAIGKAFYNAIPADVIQCMTASARAETCTALIKNAKIIANCVVAHITACAQVTVAAGIDVTIPLTSPEGSPSSGTTSATGTGTIS